MRKRTRPTPVGKGASSEKRKSLQDVRGGGFNSSGGEVLLARGGRLQGADVYGRYTKERGGRRVDESLLSGRET